MAIRNIVKEGDGILGKKCRPVEKFDPKLWMLLDDMKETLREANGVGLAAPQVGILRRVVIVNIGDEDGDIELINPEIVEASGEQDGPEGCLSCPGEWGMVRRPSHVVVKAQNRRGEFFEITGEELTMYISFSFSWSSASVSSPKGFFCGPYTSVISTVMAFPASFISSRRGRISWGRNW